MRPLELRLRNFRSFFGDGHTFDFRDRNLVGIVGPIGAGKSTILDAIVFALYGRTPRVNQSTKTLIHQRADHAAVALRFEVDGQIWEAVRQLRAKGQSQHALYLFEEDVPDPETVSEKIVLQSEVNDRIEALLGLDYDAFGRSVLLAQGQFDEFLNSRPAERDKVLKGVFGHERIDAMREVAKATVKDLSVDVALISAKLDSAEAAKERIGARRGDLATRDAWRNRLELARPVVMKLHGAIDEAETRLGEASKELAELNKLADRLPDPTQSEKTIGQAEGAGQRRQELADRLETAAEVASGAEEAIKSDEFMDRRQRFSQASELVVRLEALQGNAEAAQTRHSESAARVEAAQAASSSSTEAVAAATAASEEAQGAATLGAQRVREAEQSLVDARHFDMASSLRGQLEVGGDCPVCEQPVHAIPTAVLDRDIEHAQRDMERARSARETAESLLRTVVAELEATRAKTEAAGTRVADAEADLVAGDKLAVQAQAAVEAATGELARLLGAGDPSSRLEVEQAAVDGVIQDEEAARRVVKAVQQELTEAINVQQEADRALGDLCMQLRALAEHVDGVPEIPECVPSVLRRALSRLRDSWTARTGELQKAIDILQAQLVADRGRLVELYEELNIETSIDEVLAAVRAEMVMIEGQIANDEELVEGASDLFAERQGIEARSQSYERLVEDLSASRFIRYLLEEEKRMLSDLGSDHFLRLSSGRYRFSDDDKFDVVDLTAAHAVRRADSLSGGETFLASLGLALGLSEMVGRMGGRLDAFFLDEGFGSLDSEHLDLAMEGIEALVTERMRRLVVVVSHVPELRHRIEDIIVLDKDAITGDSIVVSGAVAND